MHPLFQYLMSEFGSNCRYHSDEGLLVVALQPSKDPREYLGCCFTPLVGEDEAIRMNFYAFIRHPVEDARNQKYQEHLGSFLSTVGFELSHEKPGQLAVTGTLGKSSFEEFISWDEAEHAATEVIWRVFQTLRLATLVSHLNFRIPNRDGSDGYRKILPSRLAAMTICGTLDGATMH